MDQDAQFPGQDFAQPEFEGMQRERTADHTASGAAKKQIDDLDQQFLVQFVNHFVSLTASQRTDYGD